MIIINLMRKLIIHAGTSKTGTTSIQASLYINQKILNENNYIYFTKKIPKKPYSIILNSNYWLSKNHFYKRSKKFIKSINKFKTEKKIIISSEFFWEKSNEQIEFFIKNLDKDLQQNISILIYLRRQDFHIYSQYVEHLKRLYDNDYEDIANNDSKAINEKQKYLNNPLSISQQYLDYLSKVKFLRKIVGYENIHIKIFEKNKLKNCDVVDDFFDYLDVKDNFKKISTNYSLSFYQCHLLTQMINKSINEKFNIPELTRRFILRCLQNKNDLGSKTFVDKETIKNFYISNYHESNEILNKEFAINSRSSLFSDDFDKYPNAIIENNFKPSKFISLINSKNIVFLRVIAKTYFFCLKSFYYTLYYLAKILRTKNFEFFLFRKIVSTNQF